MKVSMKRFLLASAMAATAPALAVQYVTNETFTIKTSFTEALNMCGGTLAYAYPDSPYLRSAVMLAGAEGNNTAFDASGYSGSQAVSFQKDVLSQSGAKMTSSSDIRFGALPQGGTAGYEAVDSTTYGYALWMTDNRKNVGYTGYPYVAPDVFSFSGGAKMVVDGHAALTAWPTFSYEIAQVAATERTPVSLLLLGENMLTGDKAVLSDYDVVWGNPLAFGVDTVIEVPSNRWLVAIRQQILPVTGFIGASTPLLQVEPSGNLYTNDVHLAGGTFAVAEQGRWYYYGDVTGDGTITVEAAAANNNTERYFRGSLDGFDGKIRVYAGAGASRMDGKTQMLCFSKNFSDGKGDLYLYSASNCLSKVAFQPVQNQSGNWSVAKVEAQRLYIGSAARGGVLAGAAWELLPYQALTIGELSGGLAVLGKSGTSLTIDVLGAGSELYLSNGIPVTVRESLGEGVCMTCSRDADDSLALPAGAAVMKKIELRGGTLVLRGGAGVEEVSGVGTLVVAEGDVRIGSTSAEVTIRVSDGASVTFGTGVSLDDVLSDTRLRLWMDASDLSSYRGVTNTPTTQYPGWRETDTALGARGLVYTNDYPLVDQWYDTRESKRPSVGADGYDPDAYSQDKFYFYNDRFVRNGDAHPWPQFMPYVMTNAVNGKSVLSFDAPGTKLDKTWAAIGSDEVNVRRSLSLVKGAQRVYTAVMVFGSQDGGGRALLGGYSTSAYGTTNAYTGSACSPYFTRGGDFADRGNPSTSVFASPRDTWLDGVAVDPTTTGFSGGYQVVSFNGNGNYFRSLGYNANFDAEKDIGGARYGEILIFGGTASEAVSLSAAARGTLEQYLAQKWGIAACRPSIAGPVVVEAGGRVKTLGNFRPQGNGTWEVETDTALASDFGGTLTGKGSLCMADGVAMPIVSNFTGRVQVATNRLAFAIHDGKVIDASISPNADFVFAEELTVELAVTGSKLPNGDYTLVSGRSISGLSHASLAVDPAELGPQVKLVRQGSELVARKTPNGMLIIVR